MTIIHTKFLVHWTGKEFHIPTDAPLNDDLRDKYVETLINILKKGFEMRKGTEKIYDLDGKLLETFISHARKPQAFKPGDEWHPFGAKRRSFPACLVWPKVMTGMPEA